MSTLQFVMTEVMVYFFGALLITCIWNAYAVPYAHVPELNLWSTFLLGYAIRVFSGLPAAYEAYKKIKAKDQKNADS